MPALIFLNHTLALGLEIVALVAFSILGYRATEHPVGKWALAIVFLSAVIFLWGRFAAPTSVTRLQMPLLALFKAAIFAAATLSLFLVGKSTWASMFGIVVVIHLVLAVAIDEV